MTLFPWCMSRNMVHILYRHSNLFYKNCVNHVCLTLNGVHRLCKGQRSNKLNEEACLRHCTSLHQQSNKGAAMIEETWFKEKLSVQMSITKLLWVKKACRVPLVCLYSKRDPTRGACALCQPVVHLSVPSAPFVLIKRSA